MTMSVDGSLVLVVTMIPLQTCSSTWVCKKTKLPLCEGRLCCNLTITGFEPERCAIYPVYHPLHHIDYKRQLYRCNTSLELLGRSNLKFLRPHFYIPLQLVQLRRVHVLHDSQWQVSVLIQWGDASRETRRDELASPREGYMRLQIPTRPGPP